MQATLLRLNSMKACILNEPLLMQRVPSGTTITWLNDTYNALTDILTYTSDQKNAQVNGDICA
jgi:hypothetical protein